jgi:hypothetical protein
VDKVSHGAEAIFVPVIAQQTVDNPAPTPTAVAYTSVQDYEPRQGQKCCGCCCDYRRAVIIVNIVIMILEAIVLILVATGMLGYYIYGGDEGSDLLGKYETIEMVFSAISIVMSAVAIGGAYLYSSIMVGLNVVWLVVGYGLGIWLGLNYCNDYCDAWEDYYDDYYGYAYCTCSVNGVAAIMAAVAMVIWIYPHVGFIVQVRKGIMSRDTYAREEFSCCCV